MRCRCKKRTLSLGGHCWPSHVIVRLSISNDDEELPVGARAGFKETPHCKVDGVSGGRPSAHVRDVLQGPQSVIFCGVVIEVELHSLVIGELDGTDARSDVGDVKGACDGDKKVQHKPKIPIAYTAGAIDQEAQVHRVIARLAAEHLIDGAKFMS